MAALCVAALTLWLGRAAWPAAIFLSVGLWLSSSRLKSMATMETLVRAASRYRHDLANTVQLVSGWLELKRPQQAADALRGLERQLRLEAALSRSQPIENVHRAAPILVNAMAKGLLGPWYGSPCESPTLPLETVWLLDHCVLEGKAFSLVLIEATWHVKDSNAALAEVAAARGDGTPMEGPLS